MALHKELLKKCINYITTSLHISNEKEIIINPCAGGGELIRPIEDLTRFTFNYDTKHRPYNNNNDPEITELDFLTVNYHKFDRTYLSGLWYDKVHIISCPPEATVFSFLRKCSEFADSIAFILPTAFPYTYVPDYTLILSAELNTNYCLKVWRRD